MNKDLPVRVLCKSEMSLSSLDIRMENLEVPESPFKFDGSQRLTSSDGNSYITLHVP